MKLLVLTNLYPTPWDPNRGAFNRQQFERLAEHCDVELITAVDFRQRMRGIKGGFIPGSLRSAYFTYLYPPRFGRALHALCWYLSLMFQHGRKLRTAGYAGMLVSWGYPDAVAGSWIARRLGIQYVVKVHGSDLNVQANHAIRRWQIRSALRRAAAVVAVSNALASKAVSIGADPDRVHVIYNGVDSELFTPGPKGTARAELNLPESAPMVLFVGNLKVTKGCLDLLEAFPEVLRLRPGARLFFVGGGGIYKRIEERALSLGCANRVHCIGAVAHSSLQDWFRAADILCLPSHNEGVPNVVLEAMACGTPVVATDVGGIPEVVPLQAGILVAAGNRQALSSALVEATDRQWDPAAIASHAHAFRWQDNIQKLDSILCAATNCHPRIPGSRT